MSTKIEDYIPPAPSLNMPSETTAKPQVRVQFHHLVVSRSQILSPEQRQVLNATKRTLSSWVEIASDRLGEHRKKLQNVVQLQAGINEAFESDKQYFTSYKNVASLAREDINAVLENKADKHRHVLVLSDSNRRVQAIATIFVEQQRVYINTLLSASWNIPMIADIAPVHRELKVKGAGTTLMNLIYKIAQTENKPKIELKPLNGSVTFYQQLGMQQSWKSEGAEVALFFTLPVTAKEER
jgi:hypothetical protein